MAERCAHLDVSEEAYSIDFVTGKEGPAKVHLCCWPAANAARLTDAPSWFAKRIGPSPSIVPEADCPGCLGFKPARPRHEPEVSPSPTGGEGR